MSLAPEPLPTNAVLLHIGPHKTGTSALQTAMGAVRSQLAEHGVVYFGTRPQREQAPLAALERRGRAGIRRPRGKDWDQLVTAVKAHSEDRVVLSSERYCWATRNQARAIVDDLDRERVNVVVTLRPLDRILPSQWQMSVQGGLTCTYEEWLRSVFDENRDGTPEADKFWRRHAHGRLVSRWKSAVSASRLTVVVVDDKDRSMLPGAFEGLLGLPPGLVAPVPARSNRSLTAGEVELVRQVNTAFKDRGWSSGEQAALIRRGLSRRLVTRQPDAAELRIVTPAWALELAAQRAEESVATIRRSGVRVLGDLDQLLIDPAPSVEGPQVGAEVPAQAAALAVMGALDRVPRRPSYERGLLTTATDRFVPDAVTSVVVRGRQRVRSLRRRGRQTGTGALD